MLPVVVGLALLALAGAERVNLDNLFQHIPANEKGRLRGLSRAAQNHLRHQLDSIHIDSDEMSRVGIDMTGNVFMVERFDEENPEPVAPPRDNRNRRFISSQPPSSFAPNGVSTVVVEIRARLCVILDGVCVC